MEQDKALNMLETYRSSVLGVRFYDEEIAEFRAEKNFYPKLGMDGGNSSHSVTSVQQTYMEQLDRIIMKRHKARRKRIRIAGLVVNTIEDMEDEQEQNLLKFYYVRGYSMQETADIIGCSRGHLHKIRVSAVAHFSEKLTEKGK